MKNVSYFVFRRSRGIKKRTSGSSVKSTDSKHDENSITQDVNHNGHTEQMEHRVSEEYSTIEVINAETGVLDDQYYTIKEQKNAEYNVLNSNVPYVPDDPSYGHINKAADSNHKSESYIHIEPGTTKAISSRPRLEVPINVNEMKVGSDSRSGTQNDIKTKSNLNQFTPNETITADYSHLVQNCSGTPESNDRDSVIAKEDISGDTSLSDQRDIHDYFVLEQSQSDKSKEDANENRSNQYFLLEKTPFPDERGSASNKNAGNDEQKHSESPETKKDDRQISSKYESFDMQNHEHETEDCHEYTALENATRNKELAIALTGKTKTRNEKSSTKSENQSNEREDFSEQERIERERGHLKQGGALADRHDISQTSSENEDETIHDYFVLNKQV